MELLLRDPRKYDLGRGRYRPAPDVARVGTADDEGMSRTAQILAVVALIILVNVGLRFVDFPSANIDLPDIDVPDWLQWANKIKNVLLITLLAVVVIGGVVKEARRKR